MGFRTYYQFAQFTHEQLSEVFNPEDIRSTSDWVELHTLKPDTFVMKKTEEFLTASKVRTALDKCPINGTQYECCLQAML